MTDGELIEKGEAAKQEGMDRAARAAGRRRLILETQRDLLRAIAEAPQGAAIALDDGTPSADLATRFPDAGKWRGTAVRNLAREGIIRRAGFALSKRPSSHRSVIRLWEATADASALQARLRAIDSEIAHLESVENDK
jgi:hypothetical protein